MEPAGFRLEVPPPNESAWGMPSGSSRMSSTGTAPGQAARWPTSRSTSARRAGSRSHRRRGTDGPGLDGDPGARNGGALGAAMVGGLPRGSRAVGGDDRRVAHHPQHHSAAHHRSSRQFPGAHYGGPLVTGSLHHYGAFATPH